VALSISEGVACRVSALIHVSKSGKVCYLTNLTGFVVGLMPMEPDTFFTGTSLRRGLFETYTLYC
jgi:hypothetical protein